MAALTDKEIAALDTETLTVEVCDAQIARIDSLLMGQAEDGVTSVDGITQLSPAELQRLRNFYQQARSRLIAAARVRIGEDPCDRIFLSDFKP